ncbi:MAG: N-acetylglucosamine-6-phosphate deacetylase [Oscillospiraceae bacterium]|nr:N-acetylglucosamine-6-phosphate deacetylase [Oscillospiraceae bacterium]
MICIENAKVVLEDGIIWDGVVLTDGDRIVEAGERGKVKVPDGAEHVDACGAYVGPGFVDIHVHGGNGYLFDTEPEKAAEHFLAHGETSILGTFYFDLTKEGYIEATDRLREVTARQGAGKAIAGIYMEGPYMNPKYGSNPQKNKWRGDIKAEDYEEIVNCAGDLVKVWAIAPERDGVEPFMAYAKKVNPDVCFAFGHCEANAEQIRKLKKYGLKVQTHCMDATGVISACEGIRGNGPDEACMADPELYAELICDSLGIHVNSDNQRMILRNKGVDKVILISDSNVDNDGITSPDFGDVPDLTFDINGYLAGSKLTLDMCCRNIMHHTNCGIAQAFLMASRNPAKLIGIDDEVGTIEPGKRANLVFVDDVFNVKRVMLEGKFVK